MTFDEAEKLLRLRVKPEVADACRYLESRGFRFCIDFGTVTAIGQAGSDIIERGPGPEAHGCGRAR